MRWGIVLESAGASIGWVLERGERQSRCNMLRSRSDSGGVALFITMSADG